LISPQRRKGVKKRPGALVTGGAVRVGRTIALALARAGMDVVIGYHRSAGQARETVRALRALGARAEAIRADLRHPATARALVVAADRMLDGLDVIVNSAAVFARTPLATVTPAQYDAALDVNLRGPFFCCQAAAAVMGQRGGWMVNVADVAAFKTFPGYLPYTLSKAGLVALTRGLALALRRQRIAVNCVAPGAVLRPVGFSRARWARLTHGHQGSPEDVAAAVVFFATCPRYITGQVVRIDGGETQ
jgi:pteridine reductase